MSQIPGNKLSINHQTHGLKASDKNDESKVGRGLGKVKITDLAEPGNYLVKQSTSTGGVPRQTLLRERVTKVLPDEAFEQILENPRPSQIRNGVHASEALKPSSKPPIAPKPKALVKSQTFNQPQKTPATARAKPLAAQSQWPGNSVEADQNIPPLVVSSRARVKASPLPEPVRKIVEAGLGAKDEKNLHTAFQQYTREVMNYVEEHYQGSNPPAEVQEAFYNGMIELAAHGDYLKSSSFTVSGITFFKPQNKKKLALLASTILQIQQAGAAKDEAMVGSITSTVTRKGLFDPDQQKRLFQTAMGLEPVSGIALRADLKNTFREINKLEAKLANPQTGAGERRGVGTELQKKRSAEESLHEKINSHDQVMQEGERRSLDDVWDHYYGLLEQRLTTRLHEDLQTYHDSPLLPVSRKAFLNSDKIIRAASSELKKDAEGTARGKSKLLAQEGKTVESLASEIQTKQEAGIKGILDEAIKACQDKG